MYLLVSPLGYFIVDEEFKILDAEKFPRNVVEIASEFYYLEKGEVSNSLNKVLSKIKDKEIKVLNKYLFEILKEKKIRAVLIENPKDVLNKIRDFDKNIIIKEFGNEYEYRAFLKEILSELTRMKIREEFQNRDKLIIQTIESIDELDKTTNLLVNRLNEWYGLYFPELYKIINDNELFVKIISNVVNRSDFNEKVLKNFNLNEDKIKKIIEASKNSIGTDLPEEDLEKIKEMAVLVRSLYERRKDLENYLEGLMKEIAPNVYSITGATIGARLITKAGGIKKLAELPASTIQVLGAERALFKHLKFGAKPPKHGILFQHPLVHSAPKVHRGKIARLLANKIALAARLDYYGQREMGENLKKEIMQRVEMIKKLPIKPKKKTKKK